MATDVVQHTAPVPTDQQAYALLLGTFGYITEERFCRTLLDGRGHADMLACHLMTWILDWFRPTRDGRPRVRGGRLYLPSAVLCERWNCSPKAFRTARAAISHAGLVTFRTQQHACWIEVHWDAVAGVLQSDADRLGQPRLAENGQSGLPRLAENGQSGASDCPKTDNILPLPSSSVPSPPGGGAGGGAQEEVQHTEGTGVGDRARALVAYGRERGRRCDGRWEAAAVRAVEDAVADGRDLDLIEAAWRAYLGDDGASRTDLGHWIRGEGLNGQPRDEGEWAFATAYERVQHTAHRVEERRRVAAGGCPTPTFRLTSGGWIVQAEGIPTTFVRGVRDSDTEAEVEAAWRAQWDASHSR